MAGPEVPQHGALNIGYNYTPTVTHLNPPIQLPGTGELWANVGRTALNAVQQAGQMLQASPLNPAVRSQLYEAQDRANMGRDYIDFVRKNPSYFQGTVGEGPGGATAVAPITQSVQQQSGWNIGPGGDGTDTDKLKKQQEDAAAAKKQQQEEEKKKAPTPLPSKDLNKGLSEADSASPTTTVAFTGDDTGAGANTGGGAFGGNYQFDTQPTADQTEGYSSSAAQVGAAPPQPGSLFTAKPAAPPPPAPDQQPPAQGGSPAAATMADKASMAQWQEQNAHPVMSSQDALAWMKGQTTLAQDATYLPMGGPNGAPAFAFHMKNGGINTVPVSQMVQKGAGPLVASQNTSQVISSTDQAQQPNISPPPPANLPQMQPTGQVSGPPTGTATQPWGPPAAPTGRATGALGGQPGPYPNISPPPPPAPVGVSGQVQQQYPTTFPGPVAPGPQQPLAQADAQPVPTSAADVAAMNEESKSPTMLPGWKVDTTGNKYKELPDPQHPFWQQRFYPMTGGFQTGAWGDAENMRKQSLFEEYSGTGGVPTGVDAKGNPIILDKDTIDRMSPAEQEAWLEHARDYKLHTNALLPSSPDGVNLANNANAVQAAQRILDKLQYLKDNKIPMSTVSQDEFIRSKEAGWAHSKNPFEWGGWTIAAGGGPKNNFADSLNSDYDLFNRYASKVQGGHYTDAKTPQPEEWPGEIPIGSGKIGFSMPKTTDVSTIADLNKIGMTDNWDEAITHAKEVLKNATIDYQNAAANVPAANTRLPEAARKDMVDLSNKSKGYIDDPTNMIARDAKGKLTNGYGPIPVSPQFSEGGLLAKWHLIGENGQKTEYNPFAQTGQATASPSPSPTPVPREVANAAPRPQTPAEYNAIQKGRLFWDTDGKLKPHP